MGNYVVTGSASGIGRAVRERLESDGHAVITVDIRDADIVADLSDARTCEQVIAQVTERAPDGLDGLVPCAGVGPETPDIRLVPLINYFAVVQMVEGLRGALEHPSSLLLARSISLALSLARSLSLACFLSSSLFLCTCLSVYLFVYVSTSKKKYIREEKYAGKMFNRENLSCENI